jgi:hypothetical protein
VTAVLAHVQQESNPLRPGTVYAGCVKPSRHRSARNILTSRHRTSCLHTRCWYLAFFLPVISPPPARRFLLSVSLIPFLLHTMPHIPGVSHRRRASLTTSAYFAALGGNTAEQTAPTIRESYANCASAGSRGSSFDEARHGGDEVNKEDETVMDDAQGSSTATLSRSRRRALARLTMRCSAVPHHITTASRRRPKPRDASHLHSRTTVDARAHNKVRGPWVETKR